ncbi:MAG TPA: hypothetical protein VLJ14_13500 [Ktedonobacterales bacterium]|nr:hypothetical protein [Ktedonobacterales bacterium]
MSYHVETVAGSSRVGDDGPPLSAQFSSIQGIAIDRLGNLYISDTDHHRIRKVSGGVVTTIAGTGIPGFSGDGKAATAAQLNLPYGIALDSGGNLYVADAGNHRVRCITPQGVISTVAGTGKRASSSDGLPPAETSLLAPRNVAADAAGNLYIAEFEGHRVRRLTPDGKFTTVAGTGVAGWSGDGKAASLAQVSYPAGLAFDRAGALYVADSGNHAVRKIYADGSIGTVLGRNTATQLYTPLAVAVDPAGTIFVGDSTFTVHAFTTAAKWIIYAGNGVPAFSGDGDVAASASLTSVNDLATDQSGNLLIADGIRIRRVDTLGAIRTLAGDGYVHAVGDGDAATSAQLYQPGALVLDTLGNLFVADTGTQRVRQVRNARISTLAGTGTAGLAGLNNPMGLAMDRSGNVLVADTFNHRILSIAPSKVVRVLAGTGKPGVSPEGTAPLAAQLLSPRSVCATLAGDVYIVDSGNHRVLRLPPGGALQTAAGNGSKGSAGDEGMARLAQLNAPSACVTDTAGNLFVADTGNHAIRKVTLAGTISTVAGTFAEGSAGDEGLAVSARLSQPRGVAVDDMGDIYIADTGNHRLRQVTPDGLIHNIAGTGGFGFAGDGGPALSALLNGPQGVFLDGAGNVYFADTGNNRIRRLVADVPAPPPVAKIEDVAVFNALSLSAGAVAPGEIVSIFGSAIGPETGVVGALDAEGLLACDTGGVTVTFDGTAAPLYYAQKGQVNAQVPYILASSESTRVEVKYLGKVVGAAQVAVAPSAPALSTTATNSDGVVNAASAPAQRLTWMTFYATGEGLTDGANMAGKPAASPYARPLLPIVLTVAGVKAEILFAGSAPGLIGVMQINAIVPGGFVPPGEAAVELTVGTQKTPAITVWLK